jgi:GTP-binding protein
VERTSVLLHLVDITSEDPVADYRTIREELAAYGHGLDEKQEIVALTKIDAIDAKTAKAIQTTLKKASGTRPMLMSAVSGEGVQPVLRAIVGAVEEAKAQKEDVVPAEKEEAWRS